MRDARKRTRASARENPRVTSRFSVGALNDSETSRGFMVVTNFRSAACNDARYASRPPLESASILVQVYRDDNDTAIEPSHRACRAIYP